MQITVETLVQAPLEQVWKAYNTPADIMQWNTASADWHTTRSEVDLREGGHFSSRMEARDGSFGFDFAGTYTRVVPHSLIEYSFGERRARVEFTQEGPAVRVRVHFDPENQFPPERQREGWQAILDNFARYLQAGQSGA